MGLVMYHFNWNYFLIGGIQKDEIINIIRRWYFERSCTNCVMWLLIIGRDMHIVIRERGIILII